MVMQAFLIWLHATLQTWNAFEQNEDVNESQFGQGLVEYALILVFVGVVVMALLIILGPSIGNMYQNILEAVRGTQD
jgi:Flp pilus assembly pilin Flp